MGRQIAVAMQPQDEELFLAWLRSTANVALYRSWSPSPSAVEVFTPEFVASPFYIHNLAFPWRPHFERVAYTEQDTGIPAAYFRLLGRHAPLIEYSRHPVAARNPHTGGRFYWSKLFLSQPKDIQYDLRKFDSWFTSVCRWVRRNGRLIQHGNCSLWCLPEAERALRHEA